MLFLILLGCVIAAPRHWALPVLIGTVAVVQFAFARRRFRRAAQRFQLEIDALNAIEKE
jgi:hypothetical protein